MRSALVISRALAGVFEEGAHLRVERFAGLHRDPFRHLLEQVHQLFGRRLERLRAQHVRTLLDLREVLEHEPLDDAADVRGLGAVDHLVHDAPADERDREHQLELRAHLEDLRHKAREIAEAYGVVNGDWNGFNVLHTAAARVAGLDLGLTPGRGGLDVAAMYKAADTGKLDLVWLQAADEIDAARFEKTFTVYQGHHGDAGAHVADVILPGAAYTEKDGIYLNTEGRVQYAARAAFPPGEAREDWTIIRALAGHMGINLGFDSLAELREEMFELAPHFAEQDEVKAARWAKFGSKTKIASAPVATAHETFYMTCPVSRASETMGQCLIALQADAARDAAE